MKRIIKTGLTGKRAETICNACWTQMERGYWKHDRRMETYWRFLYVTTKCGEVVFEIDDTPSVESNRFELGGTVRNGLKALTESEILTLFAELIELLLAVDLSYDDMSLESKNIDKWKSTLLAVFAFDVIRAKDALDVINSLKGAAKAKVIAKNIFDMAADVD